MNAQPHTPPTPQPTRIMTAADRAEWLEDLRELSAFHREVALKVLTQHYGEDLVAEFRKELEQ
ncbi:hypothetical protein [Deinococcus apachensis]|uniref:hypothetical protein n=1 Tax=Deinococcus apachensis TaxID=309886 RepID=UPI00038258EB|nr:hypothetical protein [Deinococcus apachensis]